MTVYNFASNCHRIKNSIRYWRRQIVTKTEAPLKPWTEMPGLKSYPIVGSLPNFLPYIGTIGPINTSREMMSKLYKRYGPIVRLGRFFSRNPMMAVFDPDVIEQVLRNENVQPNRDGFKTMKYFRGEIRNDVFGGASGLISAQGPEWKSFRSKVNPPMLMPHIVKVYKTSIEEVTNEMMDRLDELKKDPEYLSNNLDFEMSRWSLESVGLVALGKRIGCFKENLADNDPARQLIKSVRDILILTHTVEMGPPLWRYYQSKNFKNLMRAQEIHLEISQKYIQEAIDSIKKRAVPLAPEDKSILEKLLEVDYKVAVVMSIDMLVAGVDSVANQTIAILYLLATNRDKQAKLRQEVRANNTSYVKAVIKEGMRLCGVLGSNVRGTTKEHKIAGYLVPKGVDIIFGHECLAIQDSYYPQAAKFIPERYLVDRSDPLHHSHAHPMVSLPFGFGVRSCIGRRIAEFEMESFLTQFVDRYEVDWYGDPINYVTRSLNMYLKPFNFVISKAPQ